MRREVLSSNTKGVGAFVEGDTRELEWMALHGDRQIRRIALRQLKRRAKAERQRGAK